MGTLFWAVFLELCYLAAGANVPSSPIILKASDGSTLTAIVFDLAVNDLVWDPQSGRIYVSVPAINGKEGSIQALDPVALTFSAPASLGGEPSALAVAPSGRYLYAAVNQDSTVRRLRLPDLGPDISIPVGTDSIFGPLHALRIEVSPASDKTIAVAVGANVSPPEDGAAIYDDDVRRPATLCGWGRTPQCVGACATRADSLQFSI